MQIAVTAKKRKAGNLQRGADVSIPLSSELAREQAQLASEQRSLSEAGSTPLSHNAASSSDLAVTSVVPSTSSTLPGHASSPIQAGLVTKESKLTIPEDLKLAREQAQLASEQRSLSEAGSTPLSHNAASSSDLAVNTVVPSTSTLPGHASSPIQAGLAVPVTRPPPVAPVTPTSAATSDTEATAMY